ncbi:MAG TPA: hypothetical protein VFQ59_01475 [Candidatus Paceibacterota bacterium]|nr:hypothetical protein [Candidatus Paceibacterota bacterium]
MSETELPIVKSPEGLLVEFFEEIIKEEECKEEDINRVLEEYPHEFKNELRTLFWNFIKSRSFLVITQLTIDIKLADKYRAGNPALGKIEIPKGEITVGVFRPEKFIKTATQWITHEAGKLEYERRKVLINPFAQIQLNIDQPGLSRLYPNMTVWDTASGPATCKWFEGHAIIGDDGGGIDRTCALVGIIPPKIPIKT